MRSIIMAGLIERCFGKLNPFFLAFKWVLFRFLVCVVISIDELVHLSHLFIFEVQVGLLSYIVFQDFKSFFSFG
jgi:hypothetical protein